MIQRVYVALGSNLAEPREQIQAALDAFERLPETRLVAVSPLYVSDPLGPADQPRFVNGVAALDTTLAPLDLLDALQAIELEQGASATCAGVRARSTWTSCCSANNCSTCRA